MNALARDRDGSSGRVDERSRAETRARGGVTLIAILRNGHALNHRSVHTCAAPRLVARAKFCSTWNKA